MQRKSSRYKKIFKKLNYIQIKDEENLFFLFHNLTKKYTI